MLPVHTVITVYMKITENPGTYSDNYDVVVILGTDYKGK